MATPFQWLTGTLVLAATFTAADAQVPDPVAFTLDYVLAELRQDPLIDGPVLLDDRLMGHKRRPDIQSMVSIRPPAVQAALVAGRQVSTGRPVISCTEFAGGRFCRLVGAAAAVMVSPAVEIAPGIVEVNVQVRTQYRGAERMHMSGYTLRLLKQGAGWKVIDRIGRVVS